MNENEFDEFFKNKLLKYSSAVPENMWQRIKQKKDKDRKAIFFKWSLSALLLIFLLAGYFILQTNKNSDKEKSIFSANKQNIEIKNYSNEALKNRGNNEPIKTKPDTTKTKQTNNRILSDKRIDNSKKNYINSDKHQNKKSKTDQYFSAKNISSDKYILKQKELPAKYIRIFRSDKDSTKIQINKASDSSGVNHKTNENIAKEYPDTSTNSQAIKIIILPKDSSSKKILTPIKNQSKKESEPPSLKNKNWFLDLYASPDIPFNIISSSGNPNFVDFMKQSFKTQISYTVGARAGISFGEYFSVKTGFQYSQINAKFNDSIPIVDRYRSIDIPFLIGYDIENSDFKTTINAGVIFNLCSWYKGRIIDSNGVTDINAANIYKHNTGLSLYIGLNFAKRLNNKIQLFTEPYFRYRLSYMTKPQAPFNQKINVAGVLFGLKYNL